MFYNIRDKFGRFTKRPAQQKARACTIVPGRLYDYRGTVVRAGQSTSNGKRHVSFHKQLHGFVEDVELSFIPKARVEQYLALA
jgi:hypothetical protein